MVVMSMLSMVVMSTRCVMMWASFPTTYTAVQGDYEAVNDLFTPISPK